MQNPIKYTLLISLFFGLILASCGSATTKKSTNNEYNATQYRIRTIAFYNLENLFDTIDEPDLLDERSPIMEMKGDISKVYWSKIDNMAKVIAEIGTKEAKAPPAIIGVCEIENITVLEDLVKSDYLKKYNYSIVHYDSQDKRGIDVALLYQSRYFKPTKSKSYNVKLYDAGDRVYTRDQLLVSGILDGEMIHLIVNHWPSRRGGEAKSRPMRMGAAKYNLQMIDSLQKMYESPKIFGLGDYNDDPINASFKEVLKSTGVKKEVKEGGVYNPMEDLFSRGFSTLGYRDNINLFDQIYMTSPVLAKDNDYKTWHFYKANIFNPNYLINQKGRYKGYPFRSFSNSSFTGGYSDHFPVYIYLIREK